MRLFLAVVVSAAAIMAADGSKRIAIPAGAVQTADGDFHYTDTHGTQWIYRKTPFGVARLEAQADAAAKVTPAEAAAGIKAIVDGDKVRFERQGPFGMWKWEKKMSELDETEKAALQKSRGAGSSNADRAKAAPS